MNVNDLPYSELIKMRCNRAEKNVPWVLMPKAGTKEFCTLIGAPTVEIIRKIDRIEDFSNFELPDNFVLKPVNGHSDKGVMILTKNKDGEYLEKFTQETFDSEKIISYQSSISNINKFGGGYIIEEYIPDIYGEDIPHDFKFFAFQGEIGVIMEVNRNKTDKQKWYFYEGDFSPIKNGKIVPGIKDFTNFRKETPFFFRELLDLAKRLSTAIPTPFARIDLYYDGKVAKVGEITLTPYYGYPYTWSKNLDYKMGGMWLNAINRMGRNIDYFY